jgi:hypothetical protein
MAGPVLLITVRSSGTAFSPVGTCCSTASSGTRLTPCPDARGVLSFALSSRVSAFGTPPEEEIDQAFEEIVPHRQ